MCLYSNQIMPIKAKKEITVYKIFINRGGYRMVTPFFRAPAFLHGELKATGKMDFKTFNCGIKPITEVNGGFIHCYTDEPCVYKLIRGGRFNFLENEILVVTQCTIKPGTLYFKSMRNEICARSISIDKIVSYQ